MQIRKAELAEIPLLNEIDADASRLFGTEPAFAFVMDYPPRDDEDFAAFIVQGRAFVSDVKGLLVGYILMGQVDLDAHIFQVSVRMDFQQSGHGRALIAEGLNWARHQQFGGVTLTTFRDASWNAPAYARMGFSILAEGEQGTELKSILQQERNVGLFKEPRVAMRRRI